MRFPADLSFRVRLLRTGGRFREWPTRGIDRRGFDFGEACDEPGVKIRSLPLGGIAGSSSWPGPEGSDKSPAGGGKNGRLLGTYSSGASESNSDERLPMTLERGVKRLPGHTPS